MKVTLDLDRLLADGNIDRSEYDKLVRLSSQGTMSLAFNLVIGFGVVAVSLGLIALVPDAVTGLVLGAGLLAYATRPGQWEVVAHICVLVGALTLAGGVVVLFDAAIPAMLGIAAGFALFGIVARSGLLVVLAVLALSSSIGARTGYMHATYFLGIDEPTGTILLFSALALVALLASLRMRHDMSRLALIAARTSVLLVNFGFWIGSLWGDSFSLFSLASPPEGAAEAAGVAISERAFVVGWAMALIAAGAWAAWAGRRWVVTVVAVFGMIHFYTQWFEWFGPNPLSIFIGGVGTLAAALGLWRFNRGVWQGRAPAAS